MTLTIFNRGPIWHAKDISEARPIPHRLSSGWRNQAEATRGIVEAFRAAGLPDPERLTGRVHRPTARALGIGTQNNNSVSKRIQDRRREARLRNSVEWRPGEKAGNHATTAADFPHSAAPTAAPLENTNSVAAANPPAQPPDSTAAEKSAAVAPPSKVPLEASARGGRSKSLAKRAALEQVQQKRREAVAAARAKLQIPAGFDNLADFLATIAEISGRREGGRRALAAAAGTDPSRLAKWLKPGATNCPTQPQLDALGAWHRAQLNDAELEGPGPGAQPPKITLRPKVHSPQANPKPKGAYKIPESLSIRLTLTARLRNVTPEKYLEQLLDKHLPSLDALKS